MGGTQEAAEGETHRSVNAAVAEPTPCLWYQLRLSAKKKTDVYKGHRGRTGVRAFGQSKLCDCGDSRMSQETVFIEGGKRRVLGNT